MEPCRLLYLKPKWMPGLQSNNPPNPPRGGGLFHKMPKRSVIARRNNVAIPDLQIRSVIQGLPRYARNDVFYMIKFSLKFISTSFCNNTFAEEYFYFFHLCV